MLEPTDRLLYLTELRPPPGYVLDRAVATTYSLDLVSLLMAPVSMAVLELEGREQALADPVAVLEALRRTVGRFAVFCQQGHISVPRQESLLYSYLEPAVIEVRPESESGVFHPKTWLLRFAQEGRPVIYRFLCLSRNLTQDRSWDTAVVLEGELEDRTYAFSRNHPLGDFVAALPGLAASDMSGPASEHVELMADEVRRVRFALPEPFQDGGGRQDLGFAPLGLRTLGPGRPSAEGCRRQMVVSPFLSDSQLAHLIEHGRRNVLISRTDSLDALSDETWRQLESSGTEVYVMDEAAEDPEEAVGHDADSFEAEDEESVEPAEDWETESSGKRRFSGLHAKLYVIEHGARDTRLWTGSANYTAAGFGGLNTEFLVGLRGRRREIGIEKILGKEEDEAEDEGKEATCLRALLHRYVRPAEQAPDEAGRRAAEKALETARRDIAQAGLRLVASETDAGPYDLRLRAQRPVQPLAGDMKASCFPLSLGRAARRDAGALASGGEVVFAPTAPGDLTRFMAFHLVTRWEGQELTASFVLNLPAEGFPADRDSFVLSSILSDRDRFLRYLLFLLAEEGAPEAVDILLGESARGHSCEFVGGLFDGMPLFERMVSAFSRSPESIDRVSRLVEELRRTQAGRAVIPEEFMALWSVFEEARGREPIA